MLARCITSRAAGSVVRGIGVLILVSCNLPTLAPRGPGNETCPAWCCRPLTGTRRAGERNQARRLLAAPLTRDATRVERCAGTAIVVDEPERCVPALYSDSLSLAHATPGQPASSGQAVRPFSRPAAPDCACIQSDALGCINAHPTTRRAKPRGTAPECRPRPHLLVKEKAAE